MSFEIFMVFWALLIFLSMLVLFFGTAVVHAIGKNADGFADKVGIFFVGSVFLPGVLMFVAAATLWAIPWGITKAVVWVKKHV